MNTKPTILIIYTGGTIGMMLDPETHALRPVNFDHIYNHVPEIKGLDVEIKSIAFEKPIDSSNMTPEIWKKIAQIIESNYQTVDGFVILHGSDTMSYTASALSFMLEGLNKPVILTGSQLPIGVTRTDGKENLITAIEIAAAQKNGFPIVPEVAIYFEYQLYRGNRTHKYSAEDFEAFESPNYPILAKAGVRLEYFEAHIHKASKRDLKVHDQLDNNIAILTLFPGLNKEYLDAFAHIKNLKALIIYSFGSGNSPNDMNLVRLVEVLRKKGVIVYNVTQCNLGKAEIQKYATNPALIELGVIDGVDITLEAALAKLMFLLGQNYAEDQITHLLKTSLRGEMSAS